MSTRAIIGVRNNQGGITGAWCWNDGYNIFNDLKRDFSSDAGIDYILNMGMFNTIFSEKEAEEFKSWRKENGIEVNETEFFHFGNSVILQDKRYRDRVAEHYKDLDEVLGQDINVAYIYENGKYEVYK